MSTPFTGRHKPVVGVVHVLPLPGSPRASASVDEILGRALSDATLYWEAGADGVILENHGDAPFPKERTLPHVPALMAVLLREVRRALPIPVGINILRNGALDAMGAAVASGASFIRVNVLNGVVATDQGLIEGCGYELLRYRRHLGARIAIFADVHVKFGTQLYEASLERMAAQSIQRGGADALIITGESTGSPPSVAMIHGAKNAVGDDSMVWVGSGLCEENARLLTPAADGVIVGTAAKQDGVTDAPVDGRRARELIRQVRIAGT